MILFISSEIDIKWKLCLNITQLIEKDSVAVILNQFHNGENNIYKEINESICRVKEIIRWKLQKKCHFCQNGW